jgi:uncharacterized protein YqgC (DUF456 family)
MFHIWIVVTAFLMLLTLITVVVPVLPGLLAPFLITIIFGFATHWRTLSSSEFIILAILFGVSLIAHYVSGMIGAKLSGASSRSLVYGLIGMILGCVALPIGPFIGLFFGILFGEVLRLKTYNQALKAAAGSLLGIAGGILVNILLGITFIICFLIFAWK